jgi:hypothetical protein
VYQDQLGLLETEDSQEYLGTQAKMGLLDHKDPLDQMDKTVFPDNQDRLANRELKGNPEQLDNQDQLDKGDFLGKPGSEAQLDNLVPMVTGVLLDLQVHREPLEL